ncbi:MAG: helix-turn-helix transcriptional regulator [Candidatus Saccharimonadales bacterium]
MSDTKTPHPFQPLGKKLRHLREERHESLAEVSAAVEINEADLAVIESGTDRPSEDILMLLISHFDIGEDFADELWELAGYESQSDPRDDDPQNSKHDDHEDLKRTATMMIMLDPRVMYSDSVEVISNQQGVILNFAQTAGPNSAPLTVSRVGMSYDQAKAVMGILHQMLYNRDNPVNTRRIEDGSSRKNNPER